MQERIENVIRSLQDVSEDLCAVSDDIWLSIDHNDSEAVSNGAKFKLNFNRASEDYSIIANKIGEILEAFKTSSYKVETLNETKALQRQARERLIQSLDQKVPYSLDHDFSYKRPIAYKLGDQYFPDLSSWSFIFRSLCQFLYERNPTAYLNLPDNPNLLSRRGTKYYSRLVEDLRIAKDYCGGVFVETNLSANGIRDNIEKLLPEFEIEVGSFQVFLREDRDALSL